MSPPEVLVGKGQYDYILNYFIFLVNKNVIV